MVECLADMLPRYCMRMAKLEVKLDVGGVLKGPPQATMLASLVMVGTPDVEILLAADRSFGQKLAAGISGLAAESLSDELCLDALGEFLNVVAGNAMSAVEEEGLEYRLEAPRFGAAPEQGWNFPIATDRGAATFVVALL